MATLTVPTQPVSYRMHLLTKRMHWTWGLASHIQRSLLLPTGQRQPEHVPRFMAECRMMAGQGSWQGNRKTEASLVHCHALLSTLHH